MPKHDLIFTPPLMNAAGILGFSPDLHAGIDWVRMGAFVTNPVSLAPRTPARGERMVPFPGGFLLHTGYPNPGLSQIVRHYARHWSRSPIPVIVHILASSVEDVARMARRLETVEGVTGIEVGLASQAGTEDVVAFTRTASGELSVIVRLPMERAAEQARHAMDAGASAVSLAPPRGTYPATDGNLIEGRLYGPAIFPLALKAARELTRLGVPTIGAGGICTQEHKDAMLKAGVLAIQLDSLLWRTVGQIPIA